MALQGQEPAQLLSSSSLDKQREWTRSQVMQILQMLPEWMHGASDARREPEPADPEAQSGPSPIAKASLDPMRPDSSPRLWPPDPSPLNGIRNDPSLSRTLRDQIRAPGPGPGREPRPDAGVRGFLAPIVGELRGVAMALSNDPDGGKGHWVSGAICAGRQCTKRSRVGADLLIPRRVGRLGYRRQVVQIRNDGSCCS